MRYYRYNARTIEQGDLEFYLEKIVSINWSDLRPWNGSQQMAFEELCCQLASCEELPNATFVRKGAPDAGVECFWKLQNGDEYGWQAKFFLSPPDNAQWNQIDDSVQTALNKHPQLTHYIICLPLDRPDARIEGRQSCLDKWNDRVKKWEKWATEKNMEVIFEYWGESEIFQRLSQEKHRGRFLFWFDKEILTTQKMINQINETIANVGPRYTPELNIELELAETFEFIARTDQYVLELRKYIGLLQRKTKQINPENAEDYLKEHVQKYVSMVESLLRETKKLTYSAVEKVDVNILSDLFESIRELDWKCETEIHDAKSQAYASEQNKKPEDMPRYHTSEKHDNWLYKIREVRKAIDNFYIYVRGHNAQLSMKPAMLLNGAAGSGKTHLLCDISRGRIDRGLSTVLLLGQNFYDSDIWEQIIKQLSLNCATKDELLGILNAAGQASGSRSLILIDAINESANKQIWTKNLGGILQTVSQYPWIGIVLSIRNTYFEYIVPQHLIQDEKLIYVQHQGFSGVEYKATKEFFRHYNIKQPDVPLLNPEFQNPLFLKLFCCGLANTGKKEVPRGSHNVTKVYENFIESVNIKLSAEHILNYDRRENRVLLAVQELAINMADRNNSRIPLSDAKNIVNKILPSNGYHNSLFYHLEKEGIITECIIHSQKSYEEAIQFSYERFSDHLIAQQLLEKFLDNNAPESSFVEGEPLASLFTSEHYWCYEGLIEAVSIQLPERIGEELIELAPHFSGRRSVHAAFLNSLIWRDPQAISTQTRNIFKEYIFPNNYNESLETLITVATIENHPFNADVLHRYLLKLKMPKRDATWSIFLFNYFGEKGAIDRLIDWAWSSDDKSHISDNSILLAAKTLAWFLTTSQRFLRDRATKALVNLLTNRIELLPILIDMFNDVDDLYVQERIYAVAYGCAMRTSEKDKIHNLAHYIYENIFKDDAPPVHVLLRDYARGVIELAIYYDIKLDIIVDKIRPPYKSTWPNNIPSKNELDDVYGYSGKDKEEKVDASLRGLYSKISCSGFSDFNRYIIQSGCHHWTSRRKGEPKKLSNKDHYDAFVASLTNRQRKAWDKLMGCRSLAFHVALISLHEKEPTEADVSTDSENELEKVEATFIKTLGQKKSLRYNDFIIPYLNNELPRNEYEYFDVTVAASFIFKRVLELGWSPKLHAKFDERRDYWGRDSKKPERIGKKYQWIAYHELLARISDNFEYKEDSWSDEKSYDGPWQAYIRDIDPSYALSDNKRESWTRTHSRCWWFPVSYDSWEEIEDDFEWLHETEDLPAIETIIQFKSEDDLNWLNMRGFYQLQEPVPPEEDVYEVERREFWYILKSYLVKKSDIERVYNWAKTRDFFGNWMPDSNENTRIFLGEYFWSPAFAFHNKPYYHHDGWTKGREGENEIPAPVLITSDGYLHESNCYDCSIDDTINIHLPAKSIADEMSLSWRGREGEWYDANGTMVAFDPSVRAKGPGSLLLNREIFLKYLEENEYDILWTVLGEKNMIGGHWGGDREWKGRLIINGVARIINGELRTDTHFVFQNPKQ